MRIPSGKNAVLTFKSKGNQGSVGRKYEGAGYLPPVRRKYFTLVWRF